MKYILTVIVTVIAVGGLSAAFTFGLHVHQPTPEEIGEDIVARVNAEREALGLNPLLTNDHLTMMAQWRSDDMVDKGYVSHTPPEGSLQLKDLCRGLGYSLFDEPVENIVTMNLVLGRTDDVTERALESWRGSPDHWKWIVSDYNVATGVGVAMGDDYVVITQLFWSRIPRSNPYLHNRAARH